MYANDLAAAQEAAEAAPSQLERRAPELASSKRKSAETLVIFDPNFLSTNKNESLSEGRAGPFAEGNLHRQL